MAFFDKKHFEGKIQIAGVDIFAVLKSQIHRDWDSEQNIPWESWHYHLCLWNEARDEAESKGIDTSAENPKHHTDLKDEYHVPYISETGFRSDFFQYEKKPTDLKMEDVKHIIEGRVKVHLGGVTELLKRSDIEPVKVVDKIPEKAWEDKDE